MSAGSRSESVTGGLSELVSKDFFMNVQLQRIPLVHRATKVFCDSRAANFAVLQSHPNSWSVFQCLCSCSRCHLLWVLLVRPPRTL